MLYFAPQVLCNTAPIHSYVTAILAFHFINTHPAGVMPEYLL